MKTGKCIVLYATMTFPCIYTTDKSGAVRSWTVSVTHHQDYSSITVIYGLLDGVKTTSISRVEVGKNLGKQNATTHETQALADAKGKWDKHLKNKGRTTIEESKTWIKLPMLAHVATRTNVAFPCYIQPKLDGYRVLYDPILDIFYSRTGKEYTCLKGTIIHQELKDAKIERVLDGELYVHGAAFETYGILRKKKLLEADIPILNTLVYHVYDVLIDGPFKGRKEYLDMLSLKGRTRIVPTCLVNDRARLDEIHKEHVMDGFEGTMVRNPDGFYNCGFRSKDLLKLKDFDDAEFEIIGHSVERDRDGTSDEHGLVIWKCLVPGGLTFDVTPKDTVTERKRLLKCADEFIGKMLTVQYMGLTKNGIPRMPKTLRKTVASVAFF